MRQHTRLARMGILMVLVVSLGLAACTTPKQPPLPVGKLRLGMAHFTNPQHVSEMLAGFIPEGTPAVTPAVMQTLDSQLAAVLAKNSKHTFVANSQARVCYDSVQKQDATQKAALRTWSAVGRCMGVDLLLVPQVLLWQERQGSGIGAVVPAGFMMDTFIIDVNSEVLISRSHFEETQAPLNENLLNAGKFLRRGGRWVATGELADEAMQQAVKELGL